jgi:hypothetical protein
LNEFSSLRVIIELEKYPSLKTITVDNIKCPFTDEGFNLEITDPGNGDLYVIYIEKTREKFLPDKSKFYIRKDKVYVALYKEVK